MWPEHKTADRALATVSAKQLNLKAEKALLYIPGILPKSA
jgi:hypothetical protein